MDLEKANKIFTKNIEKPGSYPVRIWVRIAISAFVTILLFGVFVHPAFLLLLVPLIIFSIAATDFGVSQKDKIRKTIRQETATDYEVIENIEEVADLFDKLVGLYANKNASSEFQLARTKWASTVQSYIRVAAKLKRQKNVRNLWRTATDNPPPDEVTSSVMQLSNSVEGFNNNLKAIKHKLNESILTLRKANERDTAIRQLQDTNLLTDQEAIDELKNNTEDLKTIIDALNEALKEVMAEC